MLIIYFAFLLACRLPATSQKKRKEFFLSLDSIKEYVIKENTILKSQTPPKIVSTVYPLDTLMFFNDELVLFTYSLGPVYFGVAYTPKTDHYIILDTDDIVPEGQDEVRDELALKQFLNDNEIEIKNPYELFELIMEVYQLSRYRVFDLKKFTDLNEHEKKIVAGMTGDHKYLTSMKFQDLRNFIKSLQRPERSIYVFIPDFVTTFIIDINSNNPNDFRFYFDKLY